MSCTGQRGRWYNVTVLNVQPLNEDKGDDSKDSFCEELQQVFNQFAKYKKKNFVKIFEFRELREE